MSVIIAIYPIDLREGNVKHQLFSSDSRLRLEATHFTISNVHHRFKQPQQHPLHIQHVSIRSNGPMIHPHSTSLHVPPQNLCEEFQELFPGSRRSTNDGVISGEQLVLEVQEGLTKCLLVRFDIRWVLVLGI
jgi:hypothetical protein